MTDLLSTFTIPQIILFTVLLAVTFKKVFDFMDWVKSKIRQRDEKTILKHDEEAELKERLSSLEKNVLDMTKCVETIGNKVDILMASDRDDIKAYITKEHHHFCYQEGWIDDYSLDCLERRYSHYQKEKGNSFIAALMKEIRELPKQPPRES